MSTCSIVWKKALREKKKRKLVDVIVLSLWVGILSMGWHSLYGLLLSLWVVTLSPDGLVLSLWGGTLSMSWYFLYGLLLSLWLQSN